MPREKEGYRDCLEEINRRTGDKLLLRPKDVMELTGLCYNTVVKMFDFSIGYITNTEIARKLSR